MVTYNHLLSETPPEVRNRSRKVTATITKAEQVSRGGRKGIKFVANGRAATEKVYYQIEIQLFPQAEPVTKEDKKKGIQRFEAPSEDLDCWVHCSCPYFIFHNEYVLDKLGSSERRNADNKAPHITNPEMKAYVCKHLFKAMPLALKAFKQIGVK